MAKNGKQLPRRPRIELFTGLAQPEAISLHVTSGYRPVPEYGPYREEPDARYFGKQVKLA